MTYRFRAWVLIVELDVTQDVSVDQAVKRVVDDAGKIDIVVNNPGIAYWGLTEAFSVEQAKQIFEINFFGVLRVNRAPDRRSGCLSILRQAIVLRAHDAAKNSDG